MSLEDLIASSRSGPRHLLRGLTRKASIASPFLGIFHPGLIFNIAFRDPFRQKVVPLTTSIEPLLLETTSRGPCLESNFESPEPQPQDSSTHSG